jgi:DNA-binding transcriptional MerR regulator
VSETGDTAPGRRADKPASAFRTIGEAADELDLPAHVLRFWESKFPQLKPLKRGGGRRYYRPEDLLLLRRIRQCLYKEGYTIRGVQNLLNSGSGDAVADPDTGDDPAAAPTLFPLDPLPGPTASPEDAGARASARPSLSPPARRFSPEVKEALAVIRRELLEARALLEELAGLGKGS